MQTNISTWGNSLGLRIPKELAEELGLSKGTKVDIEIQRGQLVIKKKKRKWTIEELMADMTPETLRASMSKEDWDFWQTDVGREIIEE